MEAEHLTIFIYGAYSVFVNIKFFFCKALTRKPPAYSAEFYDSKDFFFVAETVVHDFGYRKKLYGRYDAGLK